MYRILCTIFAIGKTRLAIARTKFAIARSKFAVARTKFATAKAIFAVRKTKISIKTTICSAISSRRLIEFYYHGGARLVEPFCLGEISPGDKETLLCYQVSGYTKFGEPVGWKLYRFSEISKLEVVNENFTGTRPGYDPDNLKMTTVYCCVSANAGEESGPEEVAGLVPASGMPNLSYEKGEDLAVFCQKHDELMRKFRLSHSIFPSEMADALHSGHPVPGK